MLRVSCGASGVVRIVKENPATNEVTADVTFKNIWTNAGLNFLYSTTTKRNNYPDRLAIGTGSHTPPFNDITSLKNEISRTSIVYGGKGASAEELHIEGNQCTFTRTRSITVPARNIPWELSELGLCVGNVGDVLTYALVRNEMNEVEPLQVSDIEILTIYYTIQFVYPVQLPPQEIDVEGLPPTTAIFRLCPPGYAGTSQFLIAGPGCNALSQYQTGIHGYTDANFSGGIAANADKGDYREFNINTLNRTTGFFGVSRLCANHMWELNPPITKDNTQILHIGEFWEFSNVDPV